MNKINDVFRIVLIYALFGSIWIYCSDSVVNWLVRDPDIITRLSIFKGLLFIFSTSALLYILIARFSARINKSAKALQESEERFRFLVKNCSDTLVIISADGIQRYASPGAERMSGYPVSELEGKKIDALIHPDDMKTVTAAWDDAVAHPDKIVTVQYRHIHRENQWVFCEALAQSFLDEPAIKGVIASVRDISERKLAEKETERLNEQLTQAQKMESVGRLAGGVAHDFNNMLSVILGYSELALEQVQKDQPIYPALQGIQQAAQRSANLTRQLLAFARKQTVQPKVLDLNTAVENILSMLHRLIGEDVALIWLPGDDLGQIKIDPSQIDQILANLCVNSRDAIKDTGRITIETDRVFIDETFCTEHPDAAPGEHVLLTVSDNGCGMSHDTMTHLFEPFFTTKTPGSGTGLGLATTYGIVKQNNGFIRVYSEPGLGAVFRIYLPCYADTDGHVVELDQMEPMVPGHETILLVEDEPMILKMTSLMLKQMGFHVLPASTPHEAIRLAQEYTGEISLLMTDVIMPEMNGSELAKRLSSQSPHLKLLFMSGYTANIISQHGVLDEGVHFIQKPFTKNELITRIRDVLEREADRNPL